MRAYVEHEFHLLSGDVTAVAERKCVVQCADHTGDMDEPYFEEASFDHDQLIVLGEFQEAGNAFRKLDHALDRRCH